jgi:dienelactone hydrolase
MRKIVPALLLASTCMCVASPPPPPPRARVAEEVATLVPYPDHVDLSAYVDARGEKRPITTPADWAARRAHILAAFQSVAGPLPTAERKVPLDVRTEDEVTIDHLVRRRVTYQSSPDQRVAAYLFLPPAAAGEKLPAVLCLHPTGAAGKGIVAGLTDKPNRAYALELAKRGFVTLAPDYPTFGDYTWELRPPWRSGTMRAVWDNVRAVDLLCSLDRVDAGRIGAIGHSLGGHNAIFTAVFEPRIRAVVSSCGFTRFHKYKGGNLAGWTSPRYMPSIATACANDPDRVPFDFPELIAAIAPRAFFTSSPVRDDNFDVGGVRDAIAAAAPVYKLLGAAEKLEATYPDGAHDFPDAARERAYQFLAAQLAAKPPE